MQNESIPWIPDDSPALPGSDYVALVIEWNDSAEPTLVTERTSAARLALMQVAGVALAGISALALAIWALHRRPTPAVA